MSAATIERLLAGTLPDPDAAGTLTVRTRRVVIGHGLAERAGELVAELDLPGPMALVADPATTGRWAPGSRGIGAAAAGPRRGRLRHEPAGPTRRPWPRCSTRAAGAASLLAVGSGTINDVTKCAAARSGRRYAVFGTALSMNGYTSENAAITVDGPQEEPGRRTGRGRVPRPRRAGRSTRAPDPGRARRFDLPPDGAGGLAPVPPPARHPLSHGTVSAAGAGRAATPRRAPTGWRGPSRKPWRRSPAPSCSRASAWRSAAEAGPRAKPSIWSAIGSRCGAIPLGRPRCTASRSP